jgi:hypothetical protein
VNRETKPAFYRPALRPLESLTNEELQAVYELRASKVKLDPKGFWDDNKIVYWNAMIPLLLALHEVLLEIQARYPHSEIVGRYTDGGAYFDRLLPLNEPPWVEVALVEHERKVRVYGLRELPKSKPRSKIRSTGEIDRGHNVD